MGVRTGSGTGVVGDGAGGFAGDEFGLQGAWGHGDVGVLDLFGERGEGRVAGLDGGLAEGGEGGHEERGGGRVVDADDGEVFGDLQSHGGGGGVHVEGEVVAGGEDGGRAAGGGE